MTVESMMMPKSIAPSEIRLAGVSPTRIRMNAPNSASGMLIAAIKAAPKVAEEKDQHQENQRHPDGEVLQHRVQRGFDQLGAIVVGHDLVAGGKMPELLSSLTLASTPRSVLSVLPYLRISTMPFDDLVAVVHPDDAEARRVADLDARPRCRP